MARDATPDLYWMFAIIIILGVMWFIGGGPERAEDKQVASEAEKPAPVITTPEAEEPIVSDFSIYHGDFRIRRGNAGRVIQPREEYIILEYSRRAENSVNITGWTIESSPFRGSKKATIPQGTLILTPEISDRVNVDIYLNPGERAILTTGRIPQVGSVRIDRSFKVNSCVGYLSQTGRYNFIPSIRNQCPRPADEPEVATLDDDCYNFVRRLRSCQTPEFYRNDEYEDTVDGVTGLSRSCQAFIKERFNYAGCLDNQLDKEGFWQPEWRVYLGEPWPLWASNREVITLRDSEGKIVEQLSY